MSTPASTAIGATGVIGLGLVGRALTARLAGAGIAVIGHDVSAQAMARYQDTGGRVAPDVATLGRQCHALVLAVYDTDGVVAVADALLAMAQPPLTQVLVDCSTGDAARLRALAARLASRGIDLIESPLSGSSEQIARGEATALLGAHDDALARHDALLSVLATRRVHAGGPGMGAVAKLATNLVLGLNRAALAEGMVFAQRLGLPPQRFLDMVLATPARSDAALTKGSKMVHEEFSAQSRVRQHLKDLELMLDAAAQTGQGLPLTATHARLLRAAVLAGDAELDNAAVIRQIRRETPRTSPDPAAPAQD